jgi:hypothetical protein
MKNVVIKKIDLRQVFICLRPPPLLLLGYCLGWSSDFAGSESGQIQCVKLLQNIGAGLQQDSTPPIPSQPLSSITCTLTQEGGG